MKSINIDIYQIFNEGLDKVIRNGVEEVIKRQTGAGLDFEVKDMIREHAKEIMKTEEIKEAIKNAILFWINSDEFGRKFK